MGKYLSHDPIPIYIYKEFRLDIVSSIKSKSRLPEDHRILKDSSFDTRSSQAYMHYVCRVITSLSCV